MNKRPGPARKAPIVIREGSTVRIIPANISPITLRYRRFVARRQEVGRCRDCGKLKDIAKHRTEPFKHRCARCQRKANAAYRRWYRKP